MIDSHLNAANLATVCSTARVRSVGISTTRQSIAAWREIRGVASWLAHLAGVEASANTPLSDLLSDAEAATRCAALLEGVRIEGRRAHLIAPALELSDDAVRSLGGTLAVKVNS